jgi:hypothetical protein
MLTNVAQGRVNYIEWTGRAGNAGTQYKLRSASVARYRRAEGTAR